MVRIRLQFTLRAFAAFISLLCVVFALSARIRYFQERVKFHEEEAAAYDGPDYHLFPHEKARRDYHRSFARDYQRAVFRPWIIVRETPPPEPSREFLERMARSNAIQEKQCLGWLRDAIARYKAEHENRVPTGDDSAAVSGQLTGQTNYDGTPFDGRFFGSPARGPYLPEIPPNPFTELADRECSIKLVSSKPERNDPDFGWIYDKSSGQIWSATDVTR